MVTAMAVYAVKVLQRESEAVQKNCWKYCRIFIIEKLGLLMPDSGGKDAVGEIKCK